MKTKRIGIIGAGDFGRALVEKLADGDVEIILMDSSAEKIQELSSIVPRAVQGDATILATLREAGFDTCDEVVIAIEDIKASVLATVNCKDLEIRQIIAKATSDTHARILKRLGVDWVVNPDRERALRLARSLLGHNPVDLYELADGVSIAEVPAPADLVDHTVIEAGVRQRYGLTVLGIRRMQEDPTLPRLFIIVSGPEKIAEGDNLVVFGQDSKIEDFRSKS